MKVRDFPLCNSVSQVLEVFDAMEPVEQLRHLSSVGKDTILAIYVHNVTEEARDLIHNGKVYYKARAGEILSTDEAAVYNYGKKKWL